MKYVTFYWSILTGVQDITIHKNKEEAIWHFRHTYKGYFELVGSLPRKITLPFRIGFTHRGYYVMSKRMFDRTYGKKVGAK